MQHIIIGSGTIGKATGLFLEANGFDVTYCDCDEGVLERLGRKNKINNISALENTKTSQVYWICTAEWDVKEVVSDIRHLSKYIKDAMITDPVIIRSTMPIGETEALIEEYKIALVAHIPEFLRQKTANQDVFNEDRIICGLKDNRMKEVVEKIFYSTMKKIVYTTITESEIIKYTSNCWLATQISYWNEINKICNVYKVNKQKVANAVTLDHRISRYGSQMTGEPFVGFCFPKDIKAFIMKFKENNIDPTLLKAVVKVNEELQKQ